MMPRFAFAIVLAMHAWSSELLAGQVACDPGFTECFDTMIHVGGVPHAWSGVVSADQLSLQLPPEDWQFDGGRGMTATKGDIDAINKRLDHIEELLRQEACHQQFGATAYCP
jgi:hypothetical protein